MTNKIIAIQGDHPKKLNPISDTSIFLAYEAQNKKYLIFYVKEIECGASLHPILISKLDFMGREIYQLLFLLTI